MLVDKVAGPTIHREPCERPWEARSGPCCFRESHDRIADRKGVIHFPARIQIRLKGLGKAGFDKQSFSDGGFGSGCPCSRHWSRCGTTVAPSASDEEKRDEDQR